MHKLPPIEVLQQTDEMCSVIVDIIDNFPDESLRGDNLGRLKPVVDLIRREGDSLVIVYKPIIGYDKKSVIYFDFGNIKLSGLFIDINNFDIREISDQRRPITQMFLDSRLVLAYNMVTYIADINHLHSNYDE